MNMQIDLHPNYRICSMSPVEVTVELSTWTRDEMISWLCWCHPEGTYFDKEALLAYGHVLWRNEAAELILHKIGV
ncbi:hypothetical protein [Myroides pelagicus]|uniref:Uncharacterized protein n=1 Tax=Myroides pelagicus TaxID=270914 RepID=A0A7K1GPM7_9FLAO|nr:hypothetical protein [Myroides pelagicus]MEC4114648.1 hypothetical protein [Myroides pelagicus]MTH30728.1 hypothetical protein [Myroides pelagicus]